MDGKKSVLRVISVLLVCQFGFAEESPFNVDTFFGWGGCYRPMEWTPVEIGISSTLKEPFEGAVSVSAQQDDLNTLNISSHFVLTPDIPLHLPLVTKFAFAADSCTVQLVNNRGRGVWRNRYGLWDYSSANRTLTALSEEDVLTGLVGASAFGLLRLGDETVAVGQKGRGKVYVKDKVSQMIPWDWTGFACLDLLILYDPDYSLIRPQQKRAICQWVSNGGRLLVIVGDNQLTDDNPITHILPFEPGDAKETTLGSGDLSAMGLNGDVEEKIVCRPLVARSDAVVSSTLVDSGGTCLFGVGLKGFGRAGVLAFDPADLAGNHRTKTSGFWVERFKAIIGDSYFMERREESSPQVSEGSSSVRLSTLRRVMLSSDAPEDKNRQDMNYRFETGMMQAGSNAIMEHLYKIAEMRPLSIWWVILILTLLAVLLGPVDYLVLKRKDRLPLTWVTSAGWIVLFTVGAYYGVQALRAGKMQMRVVSVTDGAGGTGDNWSTVYSGIFAPSSDDYALTGVGENQWFSGVTPTQSYVYSYNRSAATRNIYCLQHDGSNVPVSLPINIWTMQCLLTEQPVASMPFEATVRREGESVKLSISNNSDRRITGGTIQLDGGMAMDFGSVDASDSRDFSGELTTRVDVLQGIIAEYGKQMGYDPNRGYRNERAFIARGVLSRTVAIMDYLAAGAAVVTVEYEDATTPFAIGDRECQYNHIKLVRLVVFPEE
jgi:hypothetical protein